MSRENIIFITVLAVFLVGILAAPPTNNSLTGDETAKITGAATKEEQRMLGIYRLEPSFSVSGYGLFQGYAELKEMAAEIVGVCSQERNIEKCLLRKKTDFGLDCKNQDIEGIFYNFFDKFNGCLNLKEDSVVCGFSLDKLDIGAQFKRIYFIEILNDDDKLIFKLMDGSKKFLFRDFIGGAQLEYLNYGSSPERAKRVEIRLDYREDTPEIVYIVAEKESIVELSKHMIYKKDNKVYFVNKRNENRFEIDIINKKNEYILLPQKKSVVFCKDIGEKVTAYDFSYGKSETADISYRFGLSYPAIKVPPPPKNIKAEDKAKAEGSIILSWEKADIGSFDFSHYNIYCLDGEFEKNPDGEIGLKDLKPVYKVVYKNTNPNPDRWYFEMNKCYNRIGELNDIIDGKKYYFAVTTLTKSGGEGASKESANGVSEDDLAPGVVKMKISNNAGESVFIEGSGCISLPKLNVREGVISLGPMPDFKDEIKNEDGSQIKEEQLMFNIHFAKSDRILDNLEVCNVGKNKCKEFQLSTQKTTFDKDTAINNPDNRFVEGEKYCFTIVARDENGNVIKSLPYEFKEPAQWPLLDGFEEKEDI